MTLNFDRHATLTVPLSLFEKEPAEVNFGRPYGNGANGRGCKLSIESVDVLGLTLTKLKSRARQLHLCPMLGLGLFPGIRRNLLDRVLVRGCLPIHEVSFTP